MQAIKLLPISRTCTQTLEANITNNIPEGEPRFSSLFKRRQHKCGEVPFF